MTALITVVHVITCFLLILVVLIQSGKGADISASFGGSSRLRRRPERAARAALSLAQLRVV